MNDLQPQFVVETAKKAFGELAGKKIAVLGLAFKPDVDDVRESPAVEVVHLLAKAGAVVKAFEPFKPAVALPGVDTVPTLELALENADAVLLLVNHSQFRQLDPVVLKPLTSARVLLDTVNGWGGKDWAAQGFTIYRLGVG